MNQKVVFAQLNYIARFYITDSSFGAHLAQRGWKQLFSDPNDRELFSGKAVYQHVSAFLGASRDTRGIITGGICYTAQVCDLLSAFNNKDICFKTSKGASSLPFRMSPVLRIHLSPDKSAGLLMLGFDILSDYPNLFKMEDVISINYLLQKIDNQAPVLHIEGVNGPAAGLETLTAIIKALLPEGEYILSERFRLHPAVCVQTLPVDDPSYHEMVYLAAGQNERYKITAEEQESIAALYKNIHTLCRSEGFAVWSENPDPAKIETFESQFLSTFQGSYLPLYLFACLADYTLNDNLRRMSEGSLVSGNQWQLRELKLLASLDKSPFLHLQKLSKTITEEVFGLPAKVQSVSDYIEEVRYASRSRAERRLNLCVLALTLSQVIFALIQYLGIKDVLGEHPEPLQTYSWIIVGGTLLAVLALIIPWERLKKQ